MILVIDANVTDPEGNILTGSVAVVVNAPGEQAPPAQSADQLADFQRRSQMMSRGLARL